MRQDLTRAMKARDRPAVAALRQALTAVANAEAPPAPGGPSWPPPAGGLVDHPRLQLSDADVDRVLRREIDDREVAIARYAELGRPAEASALRAELATLRSYVD
jgi:hypothetical protein